MLRSCFTFLDGIGPRLEQKFRDAGILNWKDFLAAERVPGVSAQRKAYYDRELTRAERALKDGDVGFFADVLPQREAWRLYAHFKDLCCFLDCEVDGDGRVIVATVFDRFECKTLVKSVNFGKKEFEMALGPCKLLVTYNGSAFDIPKLERELGITIAVPHIDLKPLCQRLGFVGGLKDIEQQVGIERPLHLRGHPADAWKALWASGDKEWLDLVIQYNEEDTVNLYRLMEKCVALVPIKFK